VSVTLPYQTRRYVALRVLTAPSWGAPWVVRPMAQALANGFEVLSFSRVVLPDEGSAVLQYHYGKIDGKFVDPGDVPDIDQHEVRIQVLLTTGNWRTAWWGQCVATRDRCFPGAGTAAGTREYHCVDALHRLRKRPLDAHQVYISATPYNCRRNPGYNAVEGKGDREPTGADPLGLGYVAHTWPGLGDRWTDAEALQHALASSRNTDLGDPTFTLSGSTALLAGESEWDVKPLEDCRNFLTRVTDRRRGRGLAFLSWTEASATGALTPLIVVRPQILEDVDVDTPTGPVITLPGATSEDTVVDVDVIGDPRLGPMRQRSFQVAAVSETHYTGVEVSSELLRVLVSLSTVNTSLAGRWSAADATAFAATTLIDRMNNEIRWDHIWRRLGIPRTWNLTVGNGRTGTGLANSRCDYRCSDQGAIVQPAVADTLDTSPLLVSILPHLPLYKEYDYTQNPPVRFDGGSDTAEKTEAPVQAWLRSGGTSGSTDRWLNGAKDAKLTIRRDQQDLQISSVYDNDGKLRYIGDKTASTLSSRYNLNQLVLTVGLQLPHRVRFLLGTDEGEIKRILVPGHHLWLAHPGAIFAIGKTLSDGGYAASRAAAGAGATPGLLRDDRDALSRVAGQASIWYLRERQTATWTLADCGFTDGWLPADDNGDEDTGGTPEAWPELGEVVASFAFNGQAATPRDAHHPHGLRRAARPHDLGDELVGSGLEMNPARLRGHEILREEPGAAAPPVARLVILGGNTLATGQDGIKYSSSPITNIPSAYDPTSAFSGITGVGRGEYFLDGVSQGYVLVVNDGTGGSAINYDVVAGSDPDVGSPVVATKSLTVAGDPTDTRTAYVIDSLVG
jgi:hypothetical protein